MTNRQAANKAWSPAGGLATHLAPPEYPSLMVGMTGAAFVDAVLRNNVSARTAPRAGKTGRYSQQEKNGSAASHKASPYCGNDPSDSSHDQSHEKKDSADG